MPRLLVHANEATAAQRRVCFHLVDATDGLTPETGEAGGQPQVSSNGGAWTNTGIGTLTDIGNGRYYADLTQTLVQTAGTLIETRYKSANTAECPGDSVQVTAFDPNDTVRLGLTALPNAAADGAGGLPISDAGGLDLDAKIGALTFTVANKLDVNAQLISGDSNAADVLELFAEALDQSTGQVDSGTFAAGAITAAAIADGAIDAATFASNAITASAIDAGAIAEIQSGLATAADLVTIDNYIDTEIAAIISAIGTPSDLGSGASLAANLADIEGQTDDIGAAGAGLTEAGGTGDHLTAIPWNASWDAEVQSEVTDALSAALTESYRGTGATGSVAQLLYEILQNITEFSISSTTKTVLKLDGSTTAKVYTLDSSTAPTSITETT